MKLGLFNFTLKIKQLYSGTVIAVYYKKVKYKRG